jgi:hypothetical protein
MHYCNGLWQHIQNSVDSQINEFMNKTYLKLNKKLDSLTKQTHTAHNTERKGAIMTYFNCIFQHFIC